MGKIIQSVEEAIDILAIDGRVMDIPSWHWFWSDPYVLRQGLKFSLDNWTGERLVKIRIAYLLLLIEAFTFKMSQGHKTYIDGTTISTLLLSFATGIIPQDEHHLRGDAQETIAENMPDLGLKKIGERTIRASQATPISTTLLNYVTQSSLSSSIYGQDFETHRHFILQKDKLIIALKSKWYDVTGYAWGASKNNIRTSAPFILQTKPDSPTSETILKTASNKFEDEYKNSKPRPTTSENYLSEEGNIGKLVIGDVVLSIPPSAISFSSDAQAISLPTLRTSSNPVVTTNTSVPRVQLTLFFEGVNNINSKLRRLFAMYKNAPFTTVQNTTIYKLLIGKSLKPDGKTEIDKTEYFSIPVPIVLESISMHTVPGYPNTIQADVTISLFNVSPFSPSGLKFLKTTDAASEQAHYHTRKQSKAYSTAILVENDSGGELGTMTFVNQQNGDSTTVHTPKIPQDQITVYPAESWPFVKTYQSVLSDGHSYENVITANKKWIRYTSSENQDLEFRYHSTEKLSMSTYRFQRNLDNFKKIQEKLNLMYLALSATTKNSINARENYFSADRIVEVESDVTQAFIKTVVDIRNTFTLAQNLKKRFLKAGGLLRKLGSKVTTDLKVLNLDFEYMESDGTIKSILEHFLYTDIKTLDDLTSEILSPSSNDDSTKTKPNLPADAVKIYWELQKDIVESVNDEINRIITNDVDPDTIEEQTVVLTSQATDQVKLGSTNSNINIFSAPVTGISITHRNNVLPIPVSGFDRPTYQHLGGSNSNVSINIRTSNEELIKTLSEIRESSTAISRLIAAGDIQLESLDRIKLKHSLLQSMGLETFSISSININSIPSAPDWYEVFIDLIQNDYKLSSYEAIRLVSKPEDQSDAWEYFFPLEGIEFPVDSRDKKPTSDERKTARSIVATKNKAKKNAIEERHGDFIRNPITERTLTKKYLIEKLDFKLKNVYGLTPRERVDVIVNYGVLATKEQENQYYFFPLITDRYTQEQNIEKSKAYGLLLKPVMQRAQEVCGLIRKVFGHSSTIISLERQFEGYYAEFIEVLVNNLSALVKIKPEYVEQKGVSDLIVPKLATDNNDFSTIQGYMINQARVRTFNILSSRQDFYTFIKKILDEKESPLTDANKKIIEALLRSIEEFRTSLDDSIGPTYPDLPIPKFKLGDGDSGHYLFGPAFYSYIDLDLGEYNEMYNLTGSMRHSITLQLATLQGQQLKDEYTALDKDLKERFKSTIQALGEKVPRILLDEEGNFDLDKVFQKFINFQDAVFNGYVLEAQQNYELDEEGKVTSLTVDNLPDYVKGKHVLSVWRDGLKTLAEDGKTLIDSNPEVSKNLFIKVITAGALLRYYIFLSVLSGALQLKGDIINIEIKKDSKAPGNITKVRFIKADGGEYVINLAEVASTVFASDVGKGFNVYSNQSSAQPTKTDDGKEFVDRTGIEDRMYRAIIQIKQETQFLLSQETPDDYINWLGMTDLAADNKRFELEQKLKSEYESTPHFSLDRAFPTFKLFFIEENSNNLLLFDDFYRYDAVQSIDVVSSKHAASSTAIIKFSNVTNRLTGLDIASLYNETSRPELPSMYLKPGTPILLRLGYGSDYRQLPIVFQGAITEIMPGSVVEITAQSWGAELTERLGSDKPIEYGSSSPIQTLGGVIMDVLDRTHGLKHFGRWQQLGFGVGNQDTQSDSINKLALIARSKFSKWLVGLGGDFLQIKGIANSLKELLSGRSKDHLFLNIGNTLYDNIYVNRTSMETYGYINLLVGSWTVRKALKGFNWRVENQTTWEALWEVCLHLGDYVVVPLPYNEGGNLHNSPPRMTLYIGPKEGYYQIADSNITYESFEQEMKRQSLSLATSIKDAALNKDDDDDTNNSALPNDTMNVILHSTLPKIAERMVTMINKKDPGDSSTNTAIKEALSELRLNGYTNLHSIALEEFDRIYKSQQGRDFFNTGNNTETITKLWYILIGLMAGGRRSAILTLLELCPIPSSTSLEELQTLHKTKQTNSSETILYYYGNYFPYELFNKMYKGEYDATVRSDIGSVLTRAIGSSSNNEGVIEKALLEKLSKLGAASTKIFEPIVQHHFVTSYEDIISNNIIATADRMYNRVKLLYPDEPGGAMVHSYNSVISYELDGSYIRTYVSPQKNVDPNIYHDYRKAVKGLNYSDDNSMPAHISIAQQILMNQMKPMYQGQLTIIGNPSIRPHHIVHIYDDVNDITGPVEVEEVIHSFSPANGFTTTIVPNLVVYNRSMSSYIDQRYMDMLGEFRANRTLRKAISGLFGTGATLLGARGAGRAINEFSKNRLGKIPKINAGKVGTMTAKGIKKVGKYIKFPIWAYVAYKAIEIGLGTLKTYANQTIGLAGTIAGHNPLIFVPLLHNGIPYIAGMDGITSLNRSLYTVMVGHIEDANGGKLTNSSLLIDTILYNDPERLP